MRIAFYISGKASRLCQIFSRDEFDDIRESVKFVLSDNLESSEEIQELCNKNDIHYIYYDYKNLNCDKDRKVRNRQLSDEIYACLKQHGIDYLFIFGHHILSGELLENYKNRIICFHPSILPSYTGFHAIDKAIDNGEFVVGNTALFIDEGVDTGSIIMQSVMHSSNFEGENYEALLCPITDMFYRLYKVLNENRVSVKDGKVIIQGADYTKVSFYPNI